MSREQFSVVEFGHSVVSVCGMFGQFIKFVVVVQEVDIEEQISSKRCRLDISDDEPICLKVPSCISKERYKRPNKRLKRAFHLMQHVKNVSMVIQCEECEMWRIVYSKKKLDPQSITLLEEILDDIVYTCDTTFDELELPTSLKTVYVKTHHCFDPMEKVYYSCSIFTPICYY